MNTEDTIAAPATGIGGAIAIIRISGPEALAVANRAWQGKTPLAPENARTMLLGRTGGNSTLAVYMKAPASYTGDDVVELHCHGGERAASHALRLVLDAGCRMAEPGEFTFRAFASGKLDLVQAEAVADVIRAGSDQALQLAERQLAGTLSRRLDALYEQLTHLGSECESRLDFPDEELDFDPVPGAAVEAVSREIDALLATRAAGEAMREGVPLVIAGRPNAGKSSLLNRLIGYDRAIVTPIPGTTRDTVDVHADLAGIPTLLTDTAGLRDSADLVEQLGVERSRRSIKGAQITFWLLDAAGADPEAEVADMLRENAPGRIAVWNKIDLVPGRALPAIAAARISAADGTGIPELLQQYRAAVLGEAAERLPDAAVNARHAALLREAASALPPAAERLHKGEFELAAHHLADARRAIGRILGKTVEPDLLDDIFKNFCIGK